MKRVIADEPLYRVSTVFASKRRGVEATLVSGASHPKPDNTLIRGLRNAHIWADALRSGEPLMDLAQRVGQS